MAICRIECCSMTVQFLTQLRALLIAESFFVTRHRLACVSIGRRLEAYLLLLQVDGHFGPPLAEHDVERFDVVIISGMVDKLKGLFNCSSLH